MFPEPLCLAHRDPGGTGFVTSGGNSPPAHPRPCCCVPAGGAWLEPSPQLLISEQHGARQRREQRRGRGAGLFGTGTPGQGRFNCRSVDVI